MATKKKSKAKSASKTSAAKKKVAPKKKATSKKAAPKKKLAPKKAAPKKKLAPKKVVPKRKATPKKKLAPKKAAPKEKVTSRRDATGHLSPKYARDLLERSRESREDRGDDRAFLRRSRSDDDLAEELGEEAVATMTSGEDQSDRLEAVVDEEVGGPFVKTGGGEEFADGTDKSNPRSATREPYPKT